MNITGYNIFLSQMKKEEIAMGYDEIMKEITNGLTGDSDTDIAFLKKVM